MKLDRESFDFKYVSDEIMSNLSLAQDYPNVFTIKGTFSCLLHIFAKLLFMLDNFACFRHLFIFFRVTLILMQILSGIASISKKYKIQIYLTQHFVGSD